MSPLYYWKYREVVVHSVLAGFLADFVNDAGMHVVAAVIYDGAKVLVARRAPGRAHAGEWEFPGGKVESGETPRAALAREISEELDLDIQIGELLTVVTDGRIELAAYRAVIRTGHPRLRDHDRIEWRLPEDLGALEMPELDHEVRLFL